MFRKLILLGGAKGSGKSVLRATLDGHPGIFASPFHELFPEALLEIDGKRDLFGHDEISSVISRSSKLAATNQYLTAGILQADLGAGAIENIAIPGQGRQFSIPTEIGTDAENLEDVCLDLYSLFFKIMYPNVRCPNYIATMTTGYSDKPGLLLSTYPEALYIGVERPIEDIIVSLSVRPHTKRTNKIYLNDEFVSEVLEFQKNQRKMKQKYPNRVLLMGLDEILEDHGSFIKRVCNFLSVSRHECMAKYTYFGQEVSSASGEDLFSKPIDSGESMSVAEIRKLQRIMENWVG